MADEREDRRDPLDPLLRDTLMRVWKRVIGRGRQELGKVTETGRQRLALRQHQKDLDHFWIRLGKTAARLVEAGEIDHPALRKALARIEELEGRIDDLRGPEARPEAGEGAPGLARPESTD